MAAQRLLDQHALDLLERHVLERAAPSGRARRARGRRRASSAPAPAAPRARSRGPARARCRASGCVEQRLRSAPASKPRERLAVARGVAPQEVRGEQRDVLAPLAQRRQADLDGVDAEQQVLAEAAGRDLRAQVGVGRARSAARRRAACARSRRARTRRSAARAAAWPAAASGTLAISSRNSVPPSASSKRPTRSARASVNAPFTWPNSSLSNTPSDEPAHVDRDQRSRRARRGGVQPARHQLLAGAVLAGDEHVGVGRADPLHQLEHRAHRRRRGDHLGRALALAAAGSPARAAGRRAARGPARPACAASPAAARCPTASRCSRARRGASPRPRPRRCPTPSSRRPAAWRRGAWIALEQIEALAAGRGVARVVQVEQHGVEVARPRARAQRAAGRDVAVSTSKPSPRSSRRSASSTSAWSSAASSRGAGAARSIMAREPSMLVVRPRDS